ncbi:MAG TPA: POTRA domain-containing protein [Terriglobales bacterium]|nr:POTRA domain-containing protein [Terriglobales bacterium]
MRAAVLCILAAGLLYAYAAWAQDPAAAPVAVSASPEVLSAPGAIAPLAAPSVSDPSIYRSAMDKYEGLPVHDIQFRGSGLKDTNNLKSLLAQQENQPLKKQAVQKSLQSLYETGRFADLQVEAELAPNAQVTLVFVASENYFVGARRVEGIFSAPPTPNQLVNATRLQLGELFTDEKLNAAIQGIQRVLVENGYHKASVTARLEKHPLQQQVDIIFTVAPGPIARVGNITIQGNAGYPDEEVREIARLHTGDRASSLRLMQVLQNLRKKYQKQDRLLVQVSVAHDVYHPESNTVDYVFSIERGPEVDVELQGAYLRRGLIKKYVPVFEEGTVDEDLLNEGRRNLRDYFQTQGYFDVNVNVRQETDAARGKHHVIYEIDKGKRHRLLALAFDGNHYFDTDLLADRMQVAPSSFLLPHGRFSQSLLSDDLAGIQTLYRNNGFQKVKVSAEQQDNYLGQEGHLRVIIHIEEGPQSRVQTLNIEGNHAVSTDVIRGMVDTKEGQPFSDSSVASDRDNVTYYYFNNGFPNVQFEASYKQVPSDPTRVDLTYTITEGPRIFVNNVFLSGLNFTRPYVARREVQVHEGDPLSQAEMLDTQRRLYDLGIFNEVDSAIQNPDGEDQRKNVLFQVEEAKRYTFNYGFGLEVDSGTDPGQSNQPQGGTGVSPRVSFDVTRLNFMGRDHTLLFKSRYGRLEKLGLFSYEAPRLFQRENWKFIFTTFYDNTRDVRTFTADRLEGQIQAEQKYSRVTTLLYDFSYRRVKVDPRTLRIDPNLVPLLSQPVRVGIPSFTLVRDRRDDPLDARKGNYTTFNFGTSSKIFGSEASFNKLLTTNATYHQFYKKRLVFARFTEIGFEEPFGHGSQGIVPLPERFFGGGANSHRGFALNQAGPRDLQTGFPIGGNALFLNQLELRFPPFTLPYFGQDLSPVLFHDMGNVFAAASDFFPGLARLHQKNVSQCRILGATPACDFSYNVQAIGGGLRYKTPIGPIRVDVGYDLNPPAFPIPQQNRVDSLKHFNFFFSLGQTF